MSALAKTDEPGQARDGSESLLRQGWRRMRRDWATMVSAAVLLLIMGMVLAAPLLTSYDPVQANPVEKLRPPTWEHILGTDELGRDVYARLLFGGRISLSIGLVSTGISLVVGGGLGLLAGFIRQLDNPIMRLLDVILALPGILLAIAVVAALGPGVYNVMIAVGVSNLPRFARIMRGAVIGVREELYVEAAHAIGASQGRIMWREILPNCLSPVFVYGTLQLSTSILAASILSFLGLGPQPPTAEWGAMVNAGRNYLLQAPHVSLIPSLAIFVVVLCFNLVADGLRDALDPRLKT